jgi:hypothetical protein
LLIQEIQLLAPHVLVCRSHSNLQNSQQGVHCIHQTSGDVVSAFEYPSATPGAGLCADRHQQLSAAVLNVVGPVQSSAAAAGPLLRARRQVKQCGTITDAQHGAVQLPHPRE